MIQNQCMIQGNILPPTTDDCLRVVTPIVQIAPKNKMFKYKDKAKQRVYTAVLEGAELRNGLYFCAQTTPRLYICLIFV